MAEDMYDLTGWQRVPCLISELIRANKLTVLSSLTDPDGHYGHPVIYTEWGSPHQAEKPVLREYQWPQDPSRTCEHYVPVPTKVAS